MSTSATLPAQLAAPTETGPGAAPSLRGLPGSRHDDTIGAIVSQGLGRTPKTLPPVLFYDARGSELFEEITELPEYYLTRTERGILKEHASEIIGAAGAGRPLVVAELGAGSCTKTEILLEACVQAQNAVVYVPVDVSAAPLTAAKSRLSKTLPDVGVEPVIGDHARGLRALVGHGERKLVVFIGSSIGNYAHAAACGLLGSVRAALAPGDALLLGTDLRKDPARLVAAYDDAQGVTAAFNKNVLVRINHELSADFDVDRFEHRAVWNDTESRVEMHLESSVEQFVRIRALGMRVHFDAGERIHTESSHKYDDERVNALLAPAGFCPERSFTDPDGLYAVRLARAV